MKHATTMVARVLASLCQQRIISREKKNALLNNWMEGMSDNDSDSLCEIIMELDSLNQNKLWEKELKKAINYIKEVHKW